MIFEAGPSWRSQRNPSFLIRDSSPDIDCCLWGGPSRASLARLHQRNSAIAGGVGGSSCPPLPPLRGAKGGELVVAWKWILELPRD